MVVVVAVLAVLVLVWWLRVRVLLRGWREERLLLTRRRRWRPTAELGASSRATAHAPRAATFGGTREESPATSARASPVTAPAVSPSDSCACGDLGRAVANDGGVAAGDSACGDRGRIGNGGGGSDAGDIFSARPGWTGSSEAVRPATGAPGIGRKTADAPASTGGGGSGSGWGIGAGDAERRPRAGERGLEG
ncbi:hypothetical protein DFJ73DRAFT_963565 [Zopfochytrium polystomum]|nr:hypothetical protein DFJ73DRAFT_963565 [Zopfochytrium polystomum]